MAPTGAPTFMSGAVSSLLAAHYNLSGELTALASYSDQNWLLAATDGNRYIVKIANSDESRHEVAMQNAAMAHLTGKDVPVPHAVDNKAGYDITDVMDGDGTSYFMRVLSYLPGHFYADAKPETHSTALWRSLGDFLANLDNALADFEHPGACRFFDWDLAHGYGICQQKKQALDAGQAQLVEYFLEYYHSHVMPLLPGLGKSVVHNDANDYNLLVDSADKPTTITGLIDFGDMVHTHTVNELAIGCAYAMLDQRAPLDTFRAVVAAYHARRPLTDAEFDVLFGLVALRMCTTVCNAAVAYAAAPQNDYLLVSVRPAWDLLQKLGKLSPFAVRCQLRTACGLAADTGKSKKDIIAFRQAHLGKTLSLSFREPLKIVRGLGAYLYDEQGNDYLDMVNNVCHVGHCHPRVVAAGQQQMARLNTNTRFLHDNLVDYAENLLATMPEKLSVCMFVNSGSEANELAFRLARNYTGSRDILTVEGAYHGNTSACIDASPYKFDGPGGEGAPDHVHKVALPDPYRGEFRGMEAATGKAYAESVDQVIGVLAQAGRKPGAYICESLQGVAGQIIMPEGYLQAVYPKVRAAGGVCIADEVQVGFGRVGSHMWAFETQGVVPDIVTLGKPIGNGHPMAAVVTTQEIADAFVTGMEYFNTFGGNPVSCAIGMAVLDVIESEGLRENALTTGAYLQDQLRALQQDHDVIGDVRGLGLFIGAELVTDRDTKAPATDLAAALVEYVKGERVILSTEGAFHNVLKIKPPIVFSKDDADRFTAALAKGLKALC